jgi:hypothetical protein|eukprot:COSAG01_NODE_12604_length_1711_cov_2.471172_2_plen_121_part_00
MSCSAEQASRLWPYVESVLSVTHEYTDDEDEDEAGDSGSGGDTDGKGGIDLSMDVSEWLGMHGLAELEQMFSAEDVTTLEEVALVIAEEGDLELMGVPSDLALSLWPAVREILEQVKPSS